MYVEYWDNLEREWHLSKLTFWQFLLGRFCGEIAPAGTPRHECDIRHVPRSDIIFE